MFFAKIKQLFGVKDMTVGNPTAILVRFAIPLLIGNFAQQMYSTVDAIVVGKHIGDGALASVGASGPVINLIIALFVGVSAGAGILVSQFFGAKDRVTLSKIIGNVLFMSVTVSVLATIVGCIITKPFLVMMKTPPEILESASNYLYIIMIGFMGCVMYNMGAGILRGLGDSVMPLLFLILACGLNIVLDLLFVAVFQWGVPGVAIATILAQLISGICCWIRILRMKTAYDFKAADIKPDFKLCARVLRVGLPSGVTQAIFSCAQLVVQSLVNDFGTSVIATSTAIMRVDGFAMMPNFTFGIAMTTYVGQNIGAHKLDRVDAAAKHGLRLALSTCAVLVIALLFFGQPLMRCFTDTPEVIDLGSRMLRVLAFGYLCFSVTQVLGGIMRGAGDTVTPMLISIITTVCLRIPTAYGLAYLTRSELQPNGAPESLYISLLICWVIGSLLTTLFYRIGKWKNKSYKQGIGLNEQQSVQQAD